MCQNLPLHISLLFWTYIFYVFSHTFPHQWVYSYKQLYWVTWLAIMMYLHIISTYLKLLSRDDLLDIDECETDSSDCEHICRNSDGRYSCECCFGFKLNPDRRTCTEGIALGLFPTFTTPFHYLKAVKTTTTVINGTDWFKHILFTSLTELIQS